MPTLRIGLTGGIGSGKSTVAALLERNHGATLVDADALSRNTTAAGGAALPAITAAFGPQALDASGALDRAFMRQRVFSDPKAKQQLEAIIHPLVTQAIEERLQHAQAQGARCVVLDLPLLVETGRWRDRLDRILVVDCSEATQIQRVQARSGLAPAEIERIIHAQASREQRRAVADAVLLNDGINLHELTAQVREIAHKFGL